MLEHKRNLFLGGFILSLIILFGFANLNAVASSLSSPDLQNISANPTTARSQWVSSEAPYKIGHIFLMSLLQNLSADLPEAKSDEEKTKTLNFEAKFLTEALKSVNGANEESSDQEESEKEISETALATLMNVFSRAPQMRGQIGLSFYFPQTSSQNQSTYYRSLYQKNGLFISLESNE